jgi:hypothetical protein
VDRGDLDDGAARRDEPVEAFSLAELGDGAGGRVGRANAGKGFKVVADEIDVQVGPKCVQSLVIDVYAGFEEAVLQAEDDDACVDELFALDARDNANDCVVK